MKKPLLFVVSMFLLNMAFSQTQLENPGFEGPWENVAGTEDEPENWSSIKTADALGGLAPIVAWQETTDPHNGTYCIRLLASTTIGPDAAGLITNGRVHADFNPENGYVFTNESDPQWNTPFTDRPDSLVFWVKHDPEAGDQSKVEVLLHDNSEDAELPHDGSIANWVGKARADIIPAYSSWTRISVPFVYYNSSTPDYVLVALSAGDSTIAVPGTEMWIDDLEIIYNPNIVQVDPAATQNIDVDADGTLLTATEIPNAASTAPTSREWKYSTTSGGPYASFTSAETGLTYLPNFAMAGIYYVICESDFGSEMIISNEVEIVVLDPLANTVTVTPSATQSILTDEDGNLLTASETPSAADSREWKVSSTSGSGYTSFSPVNTTATITPNFASVGTYYVICEADFAGDIVISNEVQIDVPSSVGIDEEDLSFHINTNSEFITVNIENKGKAANFVLYSLGGKKVHEQVLNSTVTNISIGDSKGIYIYRVISGDRIITGKLQF